jgi:hypothetical protein
MRKISKKNLKFFKKSQDIQKIQKNQKNQKISKHLEIPKKNPCK